MLESFWDFWEACSPLAQDVTISLLCLLPGLVLGFLVLWRYRPWEILFALLWRYRWTNLLFIVLMALSVGLGTGLVAQERGIRQGIARSAKKFDLIIAAPGSRIDLMLAAVYLQATDVPLLDGRIMNAVLTHKDVDFAAPIAFGDSWQRSPIIGSTVQFVEHLSGPLAAGRLFADTMEAVVGAKVDLELGASFVPSHGRPSGDRQLDELSKHKGVVIEVVGQMQMTGSPWDRAIIVPVENVWQVHNMGTGKPGNPTNMLGPPWDEKLFPGTPAILVRARKLWANYALASEYTTKETMAFFPGTVLAQLQSLIGNIRRAMSLMAMLSQILVAVGVLSGLVVLAKLFARRFALLRALGAPRRFIFGVIWSYNCVLLGTGALLGLLVGWLATLVLSGYITRHTDIAVTAGLGWQEFQLVAAFFSIAVFCALLPATSLLRQSVTRNLRAN